MKRVFRLSAVLRVLLLVGLLVSCAGDGNPPELEERIYAHTSGLVDRDGQIVVHFRQEAGPQASGALEGSGPFRFTPSIAGRAEWQGSQMLVFTPDNPLPPGREYRCRLDLAKVYTDLAGKGRYRFRFKVKPFSVAMENLGLSPTESGDSRFQRLSGELVFADRADPDWPEHMLRVDYRGRRIVVHGELDGDGRRWFFHADSLERGDEDRELRLRWSARVARSTQRGSRQFTLPGLGVFRCQQFTERDEAAQRLVLEFSDPLDPRQDLTGLVRLTPDVPVDLHREGSRVVLQPRTRLGGRVTVTVAGALRSIHKTALGADWAGELDLREPEPGLRFMGQGTILPSGDSLLVPVECRNLRGLVVSAVRVPQENLPQFLQVNQLDGENELHRVGRRIWWKEFRFADPGPQRLEWTRHVLDLGPLARRHPDGLYHLQVFFLPEHSLATCGGSGPFGRDLPPEAQGSSEADFRTFLASRAALAPAEDWNRSQDPCAPDYYWSSWDGQPMHITGRNVLVSDIGLMATRQEDGSLLAVASRLDNAAPLAGTRLELWSWDLKRLASATADAQGFARLDDPEPPAGLVYGTESQLLVAISGKDRVFLKLDADNRLSLSGFDTDGVSAGHGLKAWLYGERGVWRPGDSLFVGCLIHDPLGTLPPDHPVQLDLFTPQGTKYLSVQRKRGTAAQSVFRLATAASAPTGTWQAVLRLGDREFGRSLLIESVRPNRLAVDLKVDDALIAGKPLTAVIEAHWLHGAPSPGLVADLSLALRDDPRPFPGFADYEFRDPSRTYQPEEIRLAEGRLDGKGRWSLDVSPLPREARPPGRLNALFTARVFEEAGLSSQRSVLVPALGWPRFVGVKAPAANGWGFLPTDRPATLGLQVLNPDGKATAATAVELTLYAIDEHWWWEQGADNIGRYLVREGIQPVRRDTVSVARDGGGWTLEVPREGWGRYLVLARDLQGGHRSGTFLFFDWPEISGSRGSGTGESVARLALKADRERYTKGQTAVIQVPSPAAAELLVSLEKGGTVLRRFRQPSTANSTRLEIPLTEAHTPTLYVHVTVLQPWRRTANDLPIRLTGVLPLAVEDPAIRLEPLLATPAEFRPGTRAAVTVSEKNGRPCTFTLAVVDEGLLDLTGSTTPDPWNHFHGKEALAVEHYDTYGRVSGALAGRLESVLALGGDTWEAPPETRVNRFPPMVEYIGPLELAAGAKRRVEFDIPEYIGSVKVMVVAAQGEAVGSVGKAVPVRSPLMVLGALPRVIGLGEECSLPVSVFVDETVKGPVEVTVTAGGGLSVDGETHQVLAAGPGEKRLSFHLRSAAVPGKGRVTLEARGGGQQGRQVLELALRHPGGRETGSTTFVIPPGDSREFYWPGEGLPGSLRGRLELSLGPPLHLGDRLESLLGHPHGCLEQIVSQAMPLLASEGLGLLPDSLQLRRTERVKTVLKDLRRFQQSDGGFSTWPGAPARDGWVNSWAGHFLLLAEQRGYRLQAGLRDNWRVWQARQATAWTSGDAAARLDQAYRLYTLAMAGAPELGAMNRLRETAGLEAATRWWLAAAYKLAGRDEAAKALVAGLALPDGATLSEGRFAAPLRDQALVLEACVVLGRRDDAARLAADVSRALDATRVEHSTQTLGWALSALSLHARTLAAGEGIRAQRIQDGRTVELSGKLPLLEVPLKAPGSGGSFTVHNTGKQPLHAVFSHSLLPKPGSGKASSSGVQLTVDYLDRLGNTLSVEAVPQGTDVTVRATVRNLGPRTLEDLALTLNLPSGWEPRGAGDTAAGLDHQDVRDDRVLSYFRLPRNGVLTVDVKAHAAFPGRYFLPPQTVQDLYSPMTQATTAGRWVKVLPAGSTP